MSNKDRFNEVVEGLFQGQFQGQFQDQLPVADAIEEIYLLVEQARADEEVRMVITRGSYLWGEDVDERVWREFRCLPAIKDLPLNTAMELYRELYANQGNLRRY